MPNTHIVELELRSVSPQSLLDRLGDAAYTVEEQLANPDAPRTRVVKDVLRPGTWKGWKVKPGTLREIARQYELARRNGEQSNLYWGSPIKTSGGQHNIEAKNAIAPIERLIVHDDVLYAVSYVTPAAEKELSNPAHKVSVKVVDPYEDGAGNTYNLFLEHVAVVDHAAVTGQQNFLTLANEDEGENPEGVDVAALISVVNDMLKIMGLSPLEGDAPQEQLVALLRTKLQTLRDLTGGPEAGEEETPTMPESTPASDVQQLEARIAELEAQNQAAQARVIELEQQQAEAARERWETELDSLFKRNRIDAATKGLLQKCGESLEYDLSNLEQYQDEDLNASGKKVRQLANGDEPNVTTVRNMFTGSPMPAPRTDEEVAADLKGRGIG